MIQALLLLLASAPAAPAQPAPAPQRFLEPIPIERVRLEHPFFVERLLLNEQVTIPHVLKQCEDTGRVQNFRVAGKLAEGSHQGLLFDDSDVYKALEAVGWTLVHRKNPGLEAQADEIIDAIAAAQMPDGYLNTYVQLTDPSRRWQDLRHGHELYCAGHLIEAGVAYARGTGKTKLLEVAKRLAARIDEDFGPGKRQDPPGHPELELALARLYEHTGEERWLKLAQFFLDRRGDPARKELYGEYAQDHLPIRQQTAVVGHAVRAGYLFAGAADVAMLAGDASLVEPLRRLWDDAWDTKTYVTGGIGTSAANEGITESFDLPNDSAYCETCASIALALWSQRMLILTGDAKYAAAIERILYNQLAGAMSVEGDTYFYDQPLGSRGEHRRQPWFRCACCPPNIARFWAQLPGMLLAQKGNTLYALQLASCSVDLEIAGAKATVQIASEFPNAGRVEAKVAADREATWNIKLRKPDWCLGARVQHDLKEQEHDLHDHEEGGNWVPFERTYQPTDGIRIHFFAPIRRVRADERVAADAGRVALARGPLIYCLEGVDNGESARSLVLPPEADLKVEDDGRILGRTRVIRGRGRRLVRADDGTLQTKVATLTAIPYHLWANREACDMVVWIPESPELAEVKGEGPSVRQNGVRVSASHVWRGDSLSALNDRKSGASPADESIPRLTFWDHKGTKEWAQYEWDEPRGLAEVSVQWFDDTGHGGCRPPAAWRVLWLDGKEWKPVTVTAESAGAAGAVQRAFTPVTTRALRIEAELQPEFSAGILEWGAR